jgi:hypothetical protein
MMEQEKKSAGKIENYRLGQRSRSPKSTHKSKAAGIEDDTFNVGALSDLAKFSKSLKNIETYVQRTYKMPNKIVKAIQNMQHPTFDPPDKPDKASCKDVLSNFDEDE